MFIFKFKSLFINFTSINKYSGNILKIFNYKYNITSQLLINISNILYLL